MIRLTLRNLLAHKLRLLMSTLAVVLGMAFLSGVLTFSNGMQSTFDNIIKGSTSDALVRAKGVASFSAGEGGVSNQTISPAVVAKLAALPQVARANGSVDGFGMSLLDHDNKLVGGQGAPTISFNYADTRNLLGKPSLELGKGAWPTGLDEVVLDTRSAKVAGYHLGDQVTVVSPQGQLVRKVRLVGTADFAGGGTAGATLVIFSTRAAQAIFLEGKDAFTSVNLSAAAGVSQKALVKAAKTVLPDGFVAVTGDQVVKESQTSVGQFLGVINTFLLVFALIAIVVGAFIIVNTFSILVAQRVRELALLRALGASRKQVTRSVMFEAFVMALIATTIGVVVGWLLALGLAALFSSFGLAISSSALTLTPKTLIISYLVGIVVTMAAAFVPARRAARVAPVAAMRDDAVPAPKSMRRRTLLGVIALTFGAVLAVTGLIGAPGNDALWIGVGAFIWIITVAVISPVLGQPLLVGCRAVFGKLFGPAGRLAGDNALRDPRRTGATASALMIGLALVGTIGVLASSMNKSLDQIVDKSFSSDFLVQSGQFVAFPTALADQMRQVTGVGVVAEQQGVQAKVRGEDKFVTANDAEFNKIYKLKVTKGTQSLTGSQALVSTKVAKKYHLKLGSPMKITFASGKPQTVKVAGIFTSEGYITSDINVPFSVLEAAGIRRQDNSVSINVTPGADKATVHRALDKVVAPIPIVPVQDRDEFATSIRGQVDQLLYLIYGLLGLAIVIAVIGIINTLGLSVLERTREIGLLRAIGLSRRRLRRMVTLESVAISVLGSVLGLLLGLIFGALLQHALRDQITALVLPAGQLIVFAVIAVVVGVLAAILPAIRASRMKVLDAISSQ